MEKDYKRWHILKNELNSRVREDHFYYKEREIWMCYLGANIGSEQDGDVEELYRPVLVLKIFSENIFWGIPITLKPHGEIYYQKFNVGGLDQYALTSQVRTLSTKRLERRITKMPKPPSREVSCNRSV